MPEILEEFPNFVYIVLGATHPDLVREQGERYRLSLERLAKNLGIKQNVIFYNRFVELDELTEFIRAADIYVTPYLNPAQITSGTLAYSFGCGKAIVSTPYWHAEELLADGRGVLVPFADSDGAGAGDLRAAARRAAAARDVQEGLPAGPGDDLEPRRPPLHGVVPAGPPRPPGPSRSSRWRSGPSPSSRPTCPTGGSTTCVRMTDSTGMFQHATYTIPNFAEGYCTDDNARALLLTVLLEELGQERAADRPARHDLRGVPPGGLRPRAGGGSATSWASTAAGWRRSARRTARGGRSGRWAPASAGRSGPTCRPGPRSYFELALPAVLEMTSPRAWAFGLLGIREYLRRFGGDRLASQVRDTLTARLIDLYERTADARLAAGSRRSSPTTTPGCRTP